MIESKKLLIICVKKKHEKSETVESNSQTIVKTDKKFQICEKMS